MSFKDSTIKCQQAFLGDSTVIVRLTIMATILLCTSAAILYSMVICLLCGTSNKSEAVESWFGMQTDQDSIDSDSSQFGKENVDLKRQRLFGFNFLPYLLNRTLTVDAECGVEGVKCVSGFECLARGGRARGKCYKGFGVCCSMEAECGATIIANETYLVNPSFPKPVTTVGNCQYNIEKIHKHICQLRFDMESVILKGPNLTSVCLEDTLSINAGNSQTPIVLCGTSSGQHLYIDLPEGSSSARVNIATAIEGIERSWKIKVTQISCFSKYKAPDNCLQYFTDYSGTINSFNYQPNDGIYQLANQKYTICIKSNPGFCGITYKSADFSLTDVGGTNFVEGRALTGDTDCTSDFLSIFTITREGVPLPDRYCGNRFEDVTTFSKPFEVRVITDNQELSGDTNNRGFRLTYLQIPC